MRKYYYQKDENSEKVYVNGKLKLENVIQDHYSMGRKLDGDAIPLLIRYHVESGESWGFDLGVPATIRLLP